MSSVKKNILFKMFVFSTCVCLVTIFFYCKGSLKTQSGYLLLLNGKKLNFVLADRSKLSKGKDVAYFSATSYSRLVHLTLHVDVLLTQKKHC